MHFTCVCFNNKYKYHHLTEVQFILYSGSFQGVQSVVTHSLQSILHSLGGIQVSHFHSLLFLSDERNNPSFL